MVKGTVPNKIGSPSLELDKAPYDINDIDAILNFLYGLLGYQNSFPFLPGL